MYNELIRRKERYLGQRRLGSVRDDVMYLETYMLLQCSIHYIAGHVMSQSHFERCCYFNASPYFEVYILTNQC